MKILIAGAGGAPSEGVINSLLRCDKGDEIIGMGSDPTDLVLSSASKKYVVPYADAPEYKEKLLKEADIVISGIGKGKYITGDMIKEGVVLIDAGTSESLKRI